MHRVPGALQVEASDLTRVPIWPWAPGALRNLIGAVLLPMVLWIAQFGPGGILR